MNEMPKINHNRNFIDEKDYSCPPGDWVKGKHGAAKNKKGSKKFRISRQRFHQNQEIRLLNNEDAILSTTKFDRKWSQR